jgi:hypothetical protein
LVVITNPSYPDPYLGRDPFEIAVTQRNFNIQGNDNRTPYTHQYSLGYSLQIGNNYAFNLDGVFADGRNQHTEIDYNYFLTPEDRANGVRPNEGIGRVTAGLTDGELEYRSFTAKVNRRFADGWQFLVSYTYATAKNDSEEFPAEHFDRAADFGHAEADRAHRMTFSGVAELPGGFMTSGIVRYQSSLPFDATAGRDLNGDGITNDRPPGVTRNQGCRGLNLGAVNDYRALNGLGPVSEVSCPDYFTVDLVVSKRINVGSTQHFEAIFQVFNLFNRANYFPPVGSTLSGSFGQSLSVADARQMELAIRFRF